MTRKTSTAQLHGIECFDCGQRIDRPGIREPRQVIHCTGSRVAWTNGQRAQLPTPHHGTVRYPACWRCNLPLGCDQCAGPIADVLCTHCAAWGTPQALAEHGPVLNTEPMLDRRRRRHAPEVSAYPLDFQAAYRASERHLHALAPRASQQEVSAQVQATADQLALPRAPVIDLEERRRQLDEQARRLGERPE